MIKQLMSIYEINGVKNKIRYLVVFVTILFSYNGFSQSLLIFGGRNHDVYLGCLNCSKYETSSIWNQYGAHGSKYNSQCIWNQYGQYGGKYSNTSPFNPHASNPPVLVDEDGNFYGYFTANKYHTKRTNNKLALFIIEYWEMIANDVGKAYETIFN